MSFHWTSTNQTVLTVAALIGCKPDSGMVNCFNKMQREGEFSNCQTIGDYLDAWLKYLSLGMQHSPEDKD
jgi:hypothetical protein